MLKIEINIPRPLQTLTLLLAGVIGALVWSQVQAKGEGDPVGGAPPVSIQEAEGEVKKRRLEQEVLSRQEDILRFELSALDHEWGELSPAEREVNKEEFRRIRRRLLSLLEHKREAEQELKSFLYELWEAQEYVRLLSRSGRRSGEDPTLTWPINPARGISASFLDEGYEKRFGIPHNAIDIPIAQGSVVHASAEGEVVNVSDRGRGYSTLTIRHSGGMITLYGHLSSFLVTEGQWVRSGQPIALSGGRPGTRGAGSLSTGPHLHFETISEGDYQDPLEFLPHL